MVSYWTDMFKVNGEVTIRNVTIFITIVIGSGVIIGMALAETLTEGIFAIYMLSGAQVYSFGKWQDESTARSKVDATAAPDVNTTTINQPDKVNVAGNAINKPTKGKK
jgi:hypothetical protein